MAPRPGTVQTASSAKRPRSASPSLRAKASKIFRTISSFSAAGTTLLPARDEALDMAPLRRRERDQLDEPSNLRGVVVCDRGFQMLTLRSRLLELPAQPAQQAHRCLVGHAE